MPGRMPRRSRFIVTLALLIASQIATPAWAWGRLGHRVISRIAEKNLNPNAKAAIAALLDEGESIADASTCADENQRRLPKTAPWHYVDVRLDEARYDSEWSADDPKKGFVVDKINEFRATLKDPKRSVEDRRFALRFVLREKTMLETQAERIASCARSVVKRVEADRQAFVRLIQTATGAQLRQATVTLETETRRLLDDAEKMLGDADLGIARLTDAIAQRARLQLAGERSEIDRMAHSIVVKSQGGLDAAARDLSHLHAQVGRDSTRLVTKAGDEIESTLDTIGSGNTVILENARKDIENFARIVVGLVHKLRSSEASPSLVTMRTRR
jgi:cell division protein FtsB